MGLSRARLAWDDEDRLNYRFARFNSNGDLDIKGIETVVQVKMLF